MLHVLSFNFEHEHFVVSRPNHFHIFASNHVHIYVFKLFGPNPQVESWHVAPLAIGFAAVLALEVLPVLSFEPRYRVQFAETHTERAVAVFGSVICHYILISQFFGVCDLDCVIRVVEVCDLHFCVSFVPVSFILPYHTLLSSVSFRDFQILFFFHP